MTLEQILEPYLPLWHRAPVETLSNKLETSCSTGSEDKMPVVRVFDAEKLTHDAKTDEAI